MLTLTYLRLLLGLLLGLGALGPRLGRAQAAGPSFTRYTTEQGLSHNGATALAKDRRGFLWVGTFNGLNRFDGVQFKVYRHTNQANSLPSNYVLRNGLSLDPLGYLWVATTRGLWRFDPVREQGVVLRVPERHDPQADSPLLSAVCFDQAGQGWFASGARLYRLDPRTLRLTSFPLPSHALSAYPNAVVDYPNTAVDAAGRVWVHFQQAAYRFDAATQRYTYYLGFDEWHPGGLAVLGLVRGEGADLYAVSAQGAWRYTAATDRFEQLAAAQFSLYALAAVRPPGEPPVVWLGGTDRLIRYEPLSRRTTHFLQAADNPLSYPGSVTMALLHDAAAGILWVATVHGLAALDPQANNFRRQLVFTPDARRYPDDVHLVQQDRAHDSLYWVLSRQAGLWRWQRGRLVPVPLPAAIGSRVRGLQQDARGCLWLGLGMSRGLARYDPATGQWQRRGRASVIQLPDEIRQLYFDHAGRLWLGTFEEGLFWYEEKTDRIRAFPLQAAARHYTVWGMQEDALGRLWVRTSQGVFRVGADRRQGQPIPIRTAGAPLKLTDVLQSAFLLDRRGYLWLSGIGFVAQADTAGRVRRTYTLANGLRADQVFGLAEDQRGHFWLATDERVHELNPTTGQFRYYGPSSGLLATAVYQTFTQNRQGDLFLGGEGGFNYFRPSQLRRNAVPPPVALTEVLVNNRPRALGPVPAVALRPGETTLTVGFAALNFSQAAKNRYAYRLLGFDPAWTTTDARTATYTNLAPGTYQLRIRAANNDEVWNQVGQTLTVRVLPAYYQTWWFKALASLALLAALWGVYRYRQAQRRQLARVRDHIAKDLHDDIGSTLSSIRIFSEVAQGQLAGAYPQTQALLERISANASTLAESMQDIIWTIKPSADGLPDVVSRMREFGLRLTEAKGIAFTMNVEEPFPVLHLSLEQRRTLYLVFKESINNAVKYAACTALGVRLSVHQRQLHLHITDNGQGFDPAAARTGNGLANLQARARDIGGQLQLASAPGAGTTVVLEAPLT